jgi:DNA-binding MarR family transcriptional regulator
MHVRVDSERRLSANELDSWAGLLRVHGTITRQLDGDLVARHGISLSDYDVLVFLANSPDRRMRMSELADSVLISQSGVTRLVDRLVRREFVEREPCPDDRRGAFAVLTDAGYAKLVEAAGTHVADVRARFLQHLTDNEQDVLARLWERILPGTSETFSRLKPHAG